MVVLAVFRRRLHFPVRLFPVVRQFSLARRHLESPPLEHFDHRHHLRHWALMEGEDHLTEGQPGEDRLVEDLVAVDRPAVAPVVVADLVDPVD